MEEADTVICLKERNKNEKNIKTNYHEAKKSQYNNNQ